MNALLILLILCVCTLSVCAFKATMLNKSKSRSHSSDLCMKDVTPGVIIGGGRIGDLLYTSNGKKDVMLSERGAAIPDTPGPIYVCTRNNDLDAIIEATPANKKGDLVFLQNGMLVPYLQKKGLGSNTQALVYFAVAKKGDSPIDGKTEVNPEGLTAATGKWAGDFRERIINAGLSCHELDYDKWYIAMLEKHIWICAFMAVGTKYGGVTVGEVESKHNEEVRVLIDQLGVAAAKATKVEFPSGLSDRLCSYAKSVAHFPTALKEFEWRNGYFAELTLEAVSKLQPDPCPAHTEIMINEGLFYTARKNWIATREKLVEDWKKKKNDTVETEQKPIEYIS